MEYSPLLISFVAAFLPCGVVTMSWYLILTSFIKGTESQARRDILLENSEDITEIAVENILIKKHPELYVYKARMFLVIGVIFIGTYILFITIIMFLLP